MEKTKSGFTVIEVALVLAIAGMIFLMVFIALPALQRSQRDTSRREAVARVISDIKDFQSNNSRGSLPGSSDNIGLGKSINVSGAAALANTSVKPTSWAGFYRDYLGQNFIDPDGETYNLVIASCGTSIPDNDCATSQNQLNTLYNAGFPNNHNIYIVTGAKCYGETAVAMSNPRNAAVLYRLEGAGIYCSSTSF